MQPILEITDSHFEPCKETELHIEMYKTTSDIPNFSKYDTFSDCGGAVRLSSPSINIQQITIATSRKENATP